MVLPSTTTSSSSSSNRRLRNLLPYCHYYHRHQYSQRRNHRNRRSSKCCWCSSSSNKLLVFIMIMIILPLMMVLYIYVFYKLQQQTTTLKQDGEITTLLSNSQLLFIHNKRSTILKPRILLMKEIDFTSTTTFDNINNNTTDYYDYYPYDGYIVVKRPPHVDDIEKLNDDKKGRTKRYNNQKRKKDDVDTITKVEVFETRRQKKHLQHSEFFQKEARESLLEDSTCMAMHPWQQQLRSCCNPFHELGLGSNFNFNEDLLYNFQMIADGGYNQVYLLEYNMGNIPIPLLVEEGQSSSRNMTTATTKKRGNNNNNTEQIVLKVLQYSVNYKYTERNYDLVRKDAMITERGTFSKHIVDGYGHCGFALMTPYAKDGTMKDHIDQIFKKKQQQQQQQQQQQVMDEGDENNYNNNSSTTTTTTTNNNGDDDDDDIHDTTKLKLVLSASFGLADLHNLDGDGIPSVVHGDIKSNQYLFVNGQYKLGDFNRGKFIRKNKANMSEACPFYMDRNDATFRSPEEYISNNKKQHHPLTYKIDIWALGSLIYQILTGGIVWHHDHDNVDEKEIQQYVAKTNSTPILPTKYQNSKNQIHVLLRTVMYDMCFIGDPIHRKSSMEIANYLKEKTKELGYTYLLDGV